MSGLFRTMATGLAVSSGLAVGGGSVAAVLMQLLGAVRPIKFMTFARNARQGHGYNQQGESFHRAA